MDTDSCQRWVERRASYRPAGETIKPTEFDVVRIHGDREAKSFVCAHHYSATYPAARERFGLYRTGALVGVAVFSIPVQPKSLNVLPGAAATKLELGRFVLLDEVPANGESWFLARCFEQLRELGFTGVVSFADPTPRADNLGRVVHPGHVGTIYQASNAVYLGLSCARTIKLLPDGTVLHARAIAKVRCSEPGWEYAAGQLERFGAAPLDADADHRAWLSKWLPRLTRSVRHRGNHKYAWSLLPRGRALLPRSLPYPKVRVGRG